MNRIEEYWKVLSNTNEWIKYSDTKATILLTLYGVLLTIIYTNAEETLNALTKSNWILVFSILSGISSIVSVVFSFLCINPRLKNENPNSIIYFGHIQSKFNNASDYRNLANEIINDDSKYIEEISEQVFTNSNIAWKKFSNVSWSIRFFFASIIFVAFSIVIYLIVA